MAHGGVTKEVRDARTTTRKRRQPSARPVRPLQAAEDLAARQPPDGGPDRHGGLDGDGGAGREDPREEAEERRGAAATVASHAGSDWTPDFTTIQDFAQLMGEDGVKLINQGVVEQAVKLGLADTRVVV